MAHWLDGLTAWQLMLLTIVVLVGLGLVSALVTAVLVRLGIHTPVSDLLRNNIQQIRQAVRARSNGDAPPG